MADNVTIEGLDRVVEDLEDYFSDEDMMSKLQKACALVERSAKQKAPKDTGELRRSITSEVRSDFGLYGVVFTPLEYAPYVEYGTGLFAEEGGRQDVPWAYEDEDTGETIWTCGQHPQPFLRPALNENRENIKRILKSGGKKKK